MSATHGASWSVKALACNHLRSGRTPSLDTAAAKLNPRECARAGKPQCASAFLKRPGGRCVESMNTPRQGARTGLAPARAWRPKMKTTFVLTVHLILALAVSAGARGAQRCPLGPDTPRVPGPARYVDVEDTGSAVRESSAGWIDLLALCDPARGTVAGGWTLQGGNSAPTARRRAESACRTTPGGIRLCRRVHAIAGLRLHGATDVSW